HSGPGGRARQFRAEGYTFDMGPSWYWMPDVFERFFEQFGRNRSDYYDLVRLDPSYTVRWNDGSAWDIPATYADLKALLEREEPGAGAQLDKFMAEAEFKYNVGINKLVYKPGQSLMEFADPGFLKGVFRLQVFSSIAKHIAKHFKSPKIRQLMAFPVLFLGALPEQTPALYSLMNYADIKGGTWYPPGGMYEIVKGMVKLAEELGVKFRYNCNIESLSPENGRVCHLQTSQGELTADIVVAGADYHHVDRHLLPERYRQYSEKYWNKRVMAPSSLIYYVGIDRKLPNLHHHTLFFDADFEKHAAEIYTTPNWPDTPLFYLCAPSVTDASVAPEGHENLFFLIPVAAGLEDTPELRERYWDGLCERVETQTGVDIRPHVQYKRSFAQSDFINDYNAFKGNAYGLANTLFQTAIFKPRMQHKHLKNLYFTGQLTVPGPGVPPSLISGEVVAKLISKQHPPTSTPATSWNSTTTSPAVPAG
ncbi:MAG: phytoene desaturase family protein, partial [Bacteroidota bacterium]